MPKNIILIASLILTLPVAFAETLGTQMTAGLPAPLVVAAKRMGLKLEALSVYVREVDASEAIIEHLSDAPRNPASTMKLLTTLAALEELGPSYQWKTEIYTDAAIKDGRLEGNLYFKGFGDPYLVIENFWRLVRGLRATGLEDISGDLVLDQSYFADEPGDPADFDGRSWRAYNVLPRALLINFQAVNFRFLPEPDLGVVRLVAEPLPANFEIENRLRLTFDRCRGWGRHVGMRFVPQGAGEKMIVSGRYSANCGENEMFRVVSDPTNYVQGVFSSLWREQGGRFQGRAREGATPPTAQLLYTAQSPPLADVIRSINKFSNNVMARQMLLTLGAERMGPPGTTDKGSRTIADWLMRHGLDFSELVLDNGAGLSRVSRISARHLAEVLLAGYQSPFMPEYMSSLPVASLDPALKKRFGVELAGRAHIKTGYLDGVRGLAGYILDREGRRIVVVMMYNHATAQAAEDFQDSLLSWIYSRP
jgi:D-alanyl-D-alanine carboxypeptidase/D-alanyl-D-alanine-endopeptidase (penicillin-binding protein 4)